MTEEASAELHARVRRFITAPEGADDFDALACDIARHQRARVPAVRRLFDAAGLDPTALADPALIPAVPTDAFRHRRIAAFPSSDDARVFMTSGTTGGSEARGRHPVRDVETYRQGAVAWGRARLFPDVERLTVIALLAPESMAPESSLTFMVTRFAEELGDDMTCFWDGERLDVDGVVAAVDALRGPALVAGTSFAFVHLLDSVEALPLPEGSRVMQTGGFKGRSRRVDAAELRAGLARAFALPEAMVLGEYGMTELSSQLYQGTLLHHLGRRDAPASPTAYEAPPWLRVTPVDPVSLSPVAPGEIGLARFVDLANVDSAIAIQTADRVRRYPDGSIELLGRAPGATPRGCSLALEHLLEDG